MSDLTGGTSASAGVPPLLSVVVPVRDEGPNIEPLIAEIRAALDGQIGYELVYVDDGSMDDTPRRLCALVEVVPGLRVVRHRQPSGQSAAILTGARTARGRLLATLDGDGQNDPADILRLLQVRREDCGPGPLLVMGERQGRRASWSRRLSSAVANTVRARVLGDRSRDTACGLKLCERSDFLALPAFDHMHRFLPALFLRAGGRVISVPVADRPRRRGRSHYGIRGRLGAGVVDMLGVLWLTRRALRPALEGEPGPGAPGPPRAGHMCSGARPAGADRSAPRR